MSWAPERLYDELGRGAEIIRALLAGITQAEAVAKPDPKTWSIVEVVCHLADEERDDFRQRLDLILHRPTNPWLRIDPEGWVTQRKYNERDLTKSLDEFVAERQRSLAWLRGLTVPSWDAAYQAPFGPIKAGDILAAWVAHDNLHTRQLVELQRGRVLTLAEPYGVRYAGDW